MAIQFKNLVDVFEQRTGAVATDAYTLTVSTEQTSGATPNPGTGGLKVQYYSVSSGTTHGFGLVAGSSSSDFLTSDFLTVASVLESFNSFLASAI